MGIKAVFGYAINVDTILLIGRHNDIEMGKPNKFFDENRFPALEVRVSGATPYLEHYVIFLKSTIVENVNNDAVWFDDPKESAGYLEGLEQLEEWAALMGGHDTNLSMTMFLEPTNLY